MVSAMGVDRRLLPATEMRPYYEAKREADDGAARVRARPHDRPPGRAHRRAGHRPDRGRHCRSSDGGEVTRDDVAATARRGARRAAARPGSPSTSSTATRRSPRRSPRCACAGRLSRCRRTRRRACRKFGAVTVPPVPHRPLRAPRAAGLYDPAHEHDGCGVACVARLDGEPRHDVIELALTALDDLEHRGAAGADPSTGDGAGVLIQLPHGFLRARVGEFGLAPRPAARPGPGRGRERLPLRATRRTGPPRSACSSRPWSPPGSVPLGWREVPLDLAACGARARDVAPEFRQLLVGAGDEVVDQDEFERRLFVARRIAELEAGAGALDPELQLADDRLQGDAHRAPALALLRRPARPGAAERARGRPLALLHQHLPELGARPAAAAARPQRRDQHPRRQRQLDARPRGGPALEPLRRRPGALPAADPRGQLRLGRLRPRARAADARRPPADPGDDDDDPGRLRVPRRHRRPSSSASTATAPR